MTYLDYSKQKVSELTLTRHTAVMVYKILKGKKGFLDIRERDIYLQAVSHFDELANECESLMLSFFEGRIDPYEDIAHS